MRNRFGIQRGEAVAELLPQLVQTGALWRTAGLASERVVLPVLSKLAELGDERAIPCLSAVLGADQASIRDAAARAVEKLMPSDLAGLVLLETTIRDRGEYASDAWWPSDRPGIDRYIPERVARAVIGSEPPTKVLGLLSFNPNGHTRELATRALAGTTDDAALVFLLLRANDWVPQVSEVARSALVRRCVPERARSFVGVLPLVERLNAQRRVDNAALIAQIETVITGTHVGVAALVAALASETDRDVRRAIARLIAVRAVPIVGFEGAFADKDPVVRTRVVLGALKHCSGTELERWLPQFLLDPAPRIRSLAFQAADAKLPDVLRAVLPGLLFDGNFWMREFARQKMGLERKGFAALYAAEIARGDSPKLRAAIAGLGEVGTVDDVAVIVPRTQTGSSRTRQVALRALFGLLKEKAVPPLVDALGSDFEGVSKVATELLLTPGLIAFGDDVAPLTRALAPHVRANALRAIAGIDKWEALIAALERAADPDARVVATAQRILARWTYAPHELYSGPKGGQRERLRTALVAAPPGFENVARTVNFILGST